MWIDKQHVLQQPDVLLLSSGTEIAYLDPHHGRWHFDAAWSEKLADASVSGWHLQRVQDACAKLMEGLRNPQQWQDGEGQDQQHRSRAHEEQEVPVTPRSPPPPPRVKLDALKHQGPFRVRMLVSGGLSNATVVAQQLEGLLSEQARLLRNQMRQRPSPPPVEPGQRPAAARKGAPSGGHPQQQLPGHPSGQPSSLLTWRVLVHGHVEGGGPAHTGWAAIDVVPAAAGPAEALRHVAQRFGLRTDRLLAACLEGGGGSGDAEAVSGLCGLGTVLVGGRRKGVPEAGAPPSSSSSSSLRGSDDPLELPTSHSTSLGPKSGRVLTPRTLGPRAVLEGLKGLGLM